MVDTYTEGQLRLLLSGTIIAHHRAKLESDMPKSSGKRVTKRTGKKKNMEELLKMSPQEYESYIRSSGE